jgi:hypothetical protein
MSPWHITEWATNVTITFNWVSNKCHLVTFVAHSVICDGDICCSLSYMWLWHLLFTQLFVEQQISPSHIHWVNNKCHKTYNWVSNRCHPHITEWATNLWWWHLLLTKLYVMVTFVVHSVICDGDICCSLSYMWWAKKVTITYSWVSNKCHHDI